MTAVRPFWRPNALPGYCVAPGCGLELDTADGLVVRADEIPWVDGLGDRRRHLLCGSHALATAPMGRLEERIERIRQKPPINPITDEPMLVSDYQLTGARFLAMRWGALLSDDKGLGKTAQFLLALPDEGDLGGLAPVIMVCPSAVKGNWADEVELWRPDYSYVILQGRNSWVPPEPGVIHIVNYEVLPQREPRCRCGHTEDRHPLDPGDVLDAPADHVAFTCLDCKCQKFRYRPPSMEEIRTRLGIRPETILGGDEVHRVKGPSSEQTKRWREVAAVCSRAWGLSASPMMNHPNELFEVYNSLGVAEAAWGNKKHFQELFKDFKKRGMAPSGLAQEEIRERRSWVELGRTAEDVGLEMPPLRFEVRKVVLTSKDVARVEELLAQAMATQRAWNLVKAGDLADPEEGEDASHEFDRRRSLLLGTTYIEAELIEAIRDAIEMGPQSKIGPEMSQIRKVLATAKLAVVRDYVIECEEADEPCVIFSAHREPARVFGNRKGWGEITGRRTRDQKDKDIRRFQRGELRGLGCTIRAAGVGLNLQRARLAGFVDWDWTPELNDQAAKRIHRRGQNRACLITSFVADHPVDRHVSTILNIKKRLIEACSIQGRST